MFQISRNCFRQIFILGIFLRKILFVSPYCYMMNRLFIKFVK